MSSMSSSSMITMSSMSSSSMIRSHPTALAQPCVGDRGLLEAAKNGDVKYLSQYVGNTVLSAGYVINDGENNNNEQQQQQQRVGNIFHIAAAHKKVNFIEKATTQILTPHMCRQLLVQQLMENWNPLHVAVQFGNVKIVELFLDVFNNIIPSSSSSSSSPPPWLQKDTLGRTPCHLMSDQDRVLPILRKDMRRLCANDNEGNSLLYLAVQAGFSKVALAILNSHFQFQHHGADGTTALHVVTACPTTEGKAIVGLLLKKVRDIFNYKSTEGYSVLHSWATNNNLWPFEWLLKSKDAKRAIVELISPASDETRWNPLHLLALNSKKAEATKIAKILIDVYKKETEAQASLSSSWNTTAPWLVQDKDGDTPLTLAIKMGNEDMAIHILTIDNNNALEQCHCNCLFYAMRENCPNVADKILDIIQEKGWTHLFFDHEEGLNALHLAPLSTEKICRRLLGDVELIQDIDGATILHHWIEKGEVWPFKCVFENNTWKSRFVELMSDTAFYEVSTPFHVAATSVNPSILRIVKLLVKAFQDENENWEYMPLDALPWFKKDRNDDGPLHYALRHGLEDLAAYILTLLGSHPMTDLLDYYGLPHKTVFKAVKYNSFEVAKMIVNQLDDEGNWTTYLMDSSNGRSILHLAPSCKDKDFGEWLIQEAPDEFMSHKDNDNKTSLDVAFNVGAECFIKALLEKHPRAYNYESLAWVEACKKGHVSAIKAFMEYDDGKFRDLCFTHKNSPLHHIKLGNLTAYEEFLKIRRMDDLINLQDDHRETPLHKAIREENILLTETLINQKKIAYEIKGSDGKTVLDLLEAKYDQLEWQQMCLRVGFDPTIRPKNFKRKENLGEIRSTLSLVAALIATITFTAGFTLPGGLNQESGAVLLGGDEKITVPFMLFLISDTLGLCCSILVLIILIWSTGCDTNRAIHLIDKSMFLFKISLFFTASAFMMGVFAVLYKKSLGLAIVVIVMCCLISPFVSRHVFNCVFRNKKPSARRGDSFNQMEQGIRPEDNENGGVQETEPRGQPNGDHNDQGVQETEPRGQPNGDHNDQGVQETEPRGQSNGNHNDQGVQETEPRGQSNGN